MILLVSATAAMKQGSLRPSDLLGQEIEEVDMSDFDSIASYSASADYELSNIMMNLAKGPKTTSSATSGEIFVMKKRRSYAGPWPKDEASCSRSPRYTGSVACKSTKWAVSTSIFGPGEAMKRLSDHEGWCTVVVGDKKGPQKGEYGMDSDKVIHISAEEQEEFMSSFATFEAVPWRTFGRKNLGFLFAVSQGAETIYDFDDDNVPLEGMPQSLHESDGMREVTSKDANFVNVNRLFGDGTLSWPRGYPLDWILPGQASAAQATQEMKLRTKTHKHSARVKRGSVNVSEIGVEQSLAQENPDVDAIYRLTRKLPLRFENLEPVVLQPGTYSPFNAQATLWHKPAFFAMLLPVTVNGRVSDILRSYVSQPLLWSHGLKVAFTSPQVEVTNRNPHNLVGDLAGEWPLYTQFSALLKDMDKKFWHSGDKGSLFAMYVYLYEHGIIEEEDVQLAFAWSQDLHCLEKSDPLLAKSGSSFAASSDQMAASRYFLNYSYGYGTASANTGTERLGNFLNDWFLLGTCQHVPPAPCQGECHGRPGSSTQMSVYMPTPLNECMGKFMMSHLGPDRPEIRPFCNGAWWWAYFWNNWQVLGESFRADVRPLAESWAQQRGINLQDISSPGHLVVHYRLGDGTSGSYSPEVVQRAVNELYSKHSLEPPGRITLLAGSYNFWVPHGTPYYQQCVQQHHTLLDMLKQRFPGVRIQDTYADIDSDWLQMAFAPVLVTTHGSFTATAAAVNTGFRASPSSQNLNFPRRAGTSPIPASLDNGKWLIYHAEPSEVILGGHA